MCVFSKMFWYVFPDAKNLGIERICLYVYCLFVFQGAAGAVLTKLRESQFGWVFNDPVDPVHLNLPDYFEVKLSKTCRRNGMCWLVEIASGLIDWSPWGMGWLVDMVGCVD